MQIEKLRAYLARNGPVELLRRAAEQGWKKRHVGDTWLLCHPDGTEVHAPGFSMRQADEYNRALSQIPQK